MDGQPINSKATELVSHKYHADARLLSGHLKRPIELEIGEHAFVSLDSARGDHRCQHMESYSVQGLISFDLGHTRVSGSRSQQHGWVTLATAVLQGLNVLDVITVDRVVAQVSTELSTLDGVPSVTFLGTRFENLRICGCPVELELDLGIFSYKPEGDKRYLEDLGFLDRVQRQLDTIARSKGLPGDLARQYESKLAHIDDLKKRATGRPKGERNGYSALQCSLVKSIGLIPVLGVKTFGNIIVIPDFGTLSLAEVEVGEFSVAPHFALTMLNVRMGSIAEGTVEVANTRLNGGARPQGGGTSAKAEPSAESLEGHQTPENRAITVTGHAFDGSAVSHFNPGESYRLRFRVGPPAVENLATGDTTVTDVPQGGLKTHWVVTSTNVEFVARGSTVKIQKIDKTWLAEFDLLIPDRGSSKVAELSVLGGAEAGNLLVTIYALSSKGAREVYREVSVNLVNRPAVEQDETCKALLHTHLRTTHEWTTPPEHIQVSIMNGVANISTKRVRLENYEFFESFPATDTLISGAIQNVRASLEKLREAHEPYLNDLNHADIEMRLGGPSWQPNYYHIDGWRPLPDGTDSRHQMAFGQVQQSAEWRALAMDGYALFDRCFPQGTKIRALLTKLLPGSRLDFHWSAQSGPGFVSHVPWALMYMEPVDVTSKLPADPEKFLGLRFRIGTRSWNVNNGSVALGGSSSTHSLHLMYWGSKAGDDVAVESQWQAGEYRKWKQSKLLPDPELPDLKNQIVLAFDSPGPSPVSVLYFYCHCSVGDGAQPCLRFGATSKLEDVVGRNDLSQRSIPDGPLLFANACTTAQSDPHMTSELEQSFFQRGVRAFIGTETKVPIALASKFAWLYFQFFYRKIDPDPMAAGEALTQARMFLWTQYKNVGGLFYSMANQYDLYFASNDEVLLLR